MNKKRVALRITLIYICVGMLWIILSDIGMQILTNSKVDVIRISMLKGSAYVFATGLMLYFLIYSSIRKIKNVESELNHTQNEISTIQGRLLELEDFNALTIQKMHDAFSLNRITLDEQGKPCDFKVIYVNSAFEDFIGLPAKDIVGKSYKDLNNSGVQVSADWVSIYGEIALTGKTITAEEVSVSKGRWISLNAYSPQKEHFVTIFHDITHRKHYLEELKQKNDELLKAREELKRQNSELNETQRKLRRIAYYDYLTGLPNHTSLADNFQAYVKIPGFKCAVLLIDVDNFKYINDTLGHAFGDLLIVSIGKRFTAAFNNRDVYRSGGDEFTVCIRGYKSISDVISNAEKAKNLMKEPFKLGDTLIYITISIGIALFPEHGKNADELLKNSDIALYKAKESGKSRYIIFDPAMNMDVQNRMLIEKNLRTALDNNELMLYYQPQLDLQTNTVTGFEALLRWQNTELGFVPPDRFIGIAEDTHLIIPLGEWVLKNACKFIKMLHNEGYANLDISVNISIVQLLQENFTEGVLSVLNEVGLDPHSLELEITESIVIKSYEVIDGKLERLREKGVKIAMDDFGKGFSSLSVLQNLKINTLKIDKVFVDNILVSEEKCLVENIIMMGHKMGLTVLAEGVENGEQMDYLKRYGCQRMQGYYYSKPLPEEKAAMIIRS